MSQAAVTGRHVPSNYWPQLDGLRCVAVCLVMWEHFRGRMPSFGAGAVGVYAFFVLSGFLITNILLGCRDRVQLGTVSAAEELRRFYARRVLRIFPLYYLMLGIRAALGVQTVRHMLPWAATYLTNVYYMRHPEWGSPIGHTWSLAVEEQFYLVWPLVVLYAPLRALPRIAVACVAVGVASKLATYATLHSFTAAAVSPLSCLDTLAAGALLAMGRRSLVPTISRRVGFAMEGLAVVALAAGVYLTRDSMSGRATILGQTAISAAVAVLAVGLIARCVRSSRGTAWLAARPLVFVGTISYGVYVWHLLMPGLAGALFGRMLHGVTLRLLFAPLAVVVAWLSYRLFERPFLRLKRLFDYAEPTRPVATASIPSTP